MCVLIRMKQFVLLQCYIKFQTFSLLLHCFLRYGFRGNPDLVLSAKPYVGEREVSLSPVTDWIEKKLAVEFQVK